MISMIWAQTPSGVIGHKGKLPWNIKEEMQHFVNYTKGKTILMGRNTWDSLNVQPLPNRKNIIITSRPLRQKYENVEIYSDLNLVLDKYKNSEEELVVIGGCQIYRNVFKYADKLVVSILNEEYPGDAFIPWYDKNVFKLVDKKEHSEFTIYYYERY